MFFAGLFAGELWESLRTLLQVFAGVFQETRGRFSSRLAGFKRLTFAGGFFGSFE